MKNVTVVYEHKNLGMQSFHVRHASTEKLQKTFNDTDIYMLDHIIEQTETIGFYNFKIYHSQNELVEFVNKWNLKY